MHSATALLKLSLSYDVDVTNLGDCGMPTTILPYYALLSFAQLSCWKLQVFMIMVPCIQCLYNVCLK